MNTKQKKPLTKLQKSHRKIGLLAGMLLFVIKGLRNNSIKSKPILNMDDNAESYDMVSLEDEIWKALNKCGIVEKKP